MKISKKILFGVTSIGLCLGGVTTLILTSCNNEEPIQLKSADEVKTYIDGHLRIHDNADRDSHEWSSGTDQDMLDYLYNINNYGPQNVVNGWLSSLLLLFDIGTFTDVIFTIEKVNNNSFSFYIRYEILSQQYTLFQSGTWNQDDTITFVNSGQTKIVTHITSVWTDEITTDIANITMKDAGEINTFSCTLLKREYPLVEVWPARPI